MDKPRSYIRSRISAWYCLLTRSMHQHNLSAQVSKTFDIAQMGPLVKLTVTHDIEPDSKKFMMAAQGWTFILNGLKTLLETGKPMPALPWKKPE